MELNITPQRKKAFLMAYSFKQRMLAANLLSQRRSGDISRERA